MQAIGMLDIGSQVLAFIDPTSRHSTRSACRQLYCLPAGAVLVPLGSPCAVALVHARAAAPHCQPFWGIHASRLILHCNTPDPRQAAGVMCDALMGVIVHPQSITLQAHLHSECCANIPEALARITQVPRWPQASLEVRVLLRRPVCLYNHLTVGEAALTPDVRARLAWCDFAIILNKRERGEPPLQFPALRNLVITPHENSLLFHDDVQLPALESMRVEASPERCADMVELLRPCAARLRSFTWIWHLHPRRPQNTPPLQLPADTAIDYGKDNYGREGDWLAGGKVTNATIFDVTDVTPRAFSAERLSVIFGSTRDCPLLASLATFRFPAVTCRKLSVSSDRTIAHETGLLRLLHAAQCATVLRISAELLTPKVAMALPASVRKVRIPCDCDMYCFCSGPEKALQTFLDARLSTVRRVVISICADKAAEVLRLWQAKNPGSPLPATIWVEGAVRCVVLKFAEANNTADLPVKVPEWNQARRVVLSLPLSPVFLAHAAVLGGYFDQVRTVELRKGRYCEPSSDEVAALRRFCAAIGPRLTSITGCGCLLGDASLRAACPFLPSSHDA